MTLGEWCRQHWCATIAIYPWRSTVRRKFQRKKYAALRGKLMRSDAKIKHLNLFSMWWRPRWHCQTLENNKLLSKRLHALENSVLAKRIQLAIDAAGEASAQFIFFNSTKKKNLNNLQSICTRAKIKSLVFILSKLIEDTFFSSIFFSITIDGKLSWWVHESCEQYGKFGSLQCERHEADAISTVATTKTTCALHSASG